MNHVPRKQWRKYIVSVLAESSLWKYWPGILDYDPQNTHTTLQSSIDLALKIDKPQMSEYRGSPAVCQLIQRANWCNRLLNDARGLNLRSILKVVFTTLHGYNDGSVLVHTPMPYRHAFRILSLIYV